MLLLSGFLCFYGLGSNGVHEQDEAWHAEAVAELYRDGHWWRLTQFGNPYFEKPAPFLWLIASGYRLLGPTVFAARFWAAFFAVAAVLATSALGTRIGGRRAGFVAGLALATSYMFVFRHCARTVQFDSLMVFSFTLSTALFLRALETNRGWVLWSVATALASYAKNFAASAPVFVFIITLLISKSPHRPTGRQWLRLGTVFAAIHLAWLVPMVVVHGRPFLANFLGHQVLGRPGLGHGQIVSSIVAVYSRNLAGGFFPWFFLGIAALPDAAYRARQRDAGSMVLLVWIGVLSLLLCTVLRQALVWYVIPLFPFLTVIGATFLVDESERPSWLRHWRTAASVALIGAALLLQLQPEAHPFALWSQDRPLRLTWNSGSSAAALTATLLAGWWILRRAARRLTWLCLLVLTASATMSVLRPLGSTTYTNVYVRAVDAILQAAPGQTAHLAVDLARAGPDRLTRYYMAGLPPARVEYHWSQPDAVLERARHLPLPAFAVLVSRRPIAALPAEYPGRVIFAGAETGTPGEAYHVMVVQIIEPSPLGRKDE
ncbi:MAG: glycosyltransferase family 39 protein [Deltaproteobacteria bacterium]|nr:glycosyltransferase family 39 protein [Deltaproteobacteria bacterium]